MKLIDLKTYVVGNPPPQHGGRYFIFLQLVTDDGHVGLGECYVATVSPDVVVTMIRDTFQRYFEGQDPHRIELIWRRVYGSGYSLRPDVSLLGVLSGLEIACWDIVGKAAGQPIYNLLGGKVQERLRAYTYLYPTEGGAYPPPGQPSVYDDPDLAAAVAAEEVARGFTAVKFDPAGPYGVFDGRQPDLAAIDLSVRMLKRIREAVGDKADLLFGTHGQFTPAGALRLAKQMEPYDPLWFEEPTPPENPKEMAKVAAGTSIPIATGERLTGKYEFHRVLEAGAAAILQMNLGRCGGILEAKKIASLAECYYAQIAPHLYCGPVVGAANVQLAACSPNLLIVESIRDWGGFHAEILSCPMRFEEGYVIPPTEPGLGVTLNEAVALAHPYEGRDLHLQPAQDYIDQAPGR